MSSGLSGVPPEQAQHFPTAARAVFGHHQYGVALDRFSEIENWRRGTIPTFGAPRLRADILTRGAEWMMASQPPPAHAETVEIVLPQNQHRRKCGGIS